MQLDCQTDGLVGAHDDVADVRRTCDACSSTPDSTLMTLVVRVNLCRSGFGGHISPLLVVLGRVLRFDTRSSPESTEATSRTSGLLTLNRLLSLNLGICPPGVAFLGEG